MIYKRALSPVLRKVTALTPKQLMAPDGEDAVVKLSGEGGQAQASSGNNNKLEAAKQLAKDNPRMVASVVANWTTGNE
jgi:flagellar M-ring protein FliF